MTWLRGEVISSISIYLRSFSNNMSALNKGYMKMTCQSSKLFKKAQRVIVCLTRNRSYHIRMKIISLMIIQVGSTTLY